MDDLDRRIAAALDAPDLPPDREPGFYALAFAIFRGRQGWVAWVMTVTQTAMFLAAVWAGWHFYAATEVLAALKWGLSAAVLAIMATQLKMALMPVIEAHRILLALRRLEARLAQNR